MKTFFLILFALISISAINAGEFDIGIRGLYSNLHPNDVETRKTLDTYSFYKTGSVKTKFSGGFGFYFNYLNNPGNFSINANYNRINNNQIRYERTDLLFLGSLGGATVNKSINDLLLSAAKSEVKIDIDREDFYTDGIFYFIPKMIGIGGGYRSIYYSSQSTNLAFLRAENESDKSTFSTRGLQTSMYFNLLLDNTTLKLRGSYFSLRGPFTRGESLTSVLLDANYNLYPYVYMTVSSGNSETKRTGYEFDFSVEIKPDPEVSSIKILTGITFQQSRVSVHNYNIRPLEFTTLPNYNYPFGTIINIIYSTLFESPVYKKRTNDRIFNIHFGVSYSFSTN